MKHNAILLALFVLGFSGTAHAKCFTVQGQGIRTMGTFTLDHPSTKVCFNPARLMTGVRRYQFTFMNGSRVLEQVSSDTENPIACNGVCAAYWIKVTGNTLITLHDLRGTPRANLSIGSDHYELTRIAQVYPNQ